MINKSWTNFEKSPEEKNPKIPLDLLELSCLNEVVGGGCLAAGWGDDFVRENPTIFMLG